MKNLLASLAAAALATAVLGLAASATAAPAGPSSVDATIDQLKAQGLDVIVNRLGVETGDKCTISAIHPGQTLSRTDSGAPGAQDDLVTTVMRKTVYLDLVC